MAKASKKGAAKKAPAKKASGKRETIAPKGDKRYVLRNSKGQIKESDDQGRSLSQDVKQTSQTKVKPGYGDRGDQKKASSKKAAPKKAPAKKSSSKKGAAKKQK